MSSPVAQLRSQNRGNINTTPMAGCVNVSGYNSGPYVVLSPVLVPYVQAPVHYVKCKPKKGSEKPSTSPAKVRYVPAYTYTTVQPHYVYHSRTCVQPIPVANMGTPYAMPINREAAGINQGYVSALAPSSSYIETLEASAVPHSDLNPLSRPYTPPSRLVKQCTCGQDTDDTEDNSCPKHPKSGRSSPELFCSGLIDDVASRTVTPIEGNTCPCCRATKEAHLSDIDSGVEGEIDDEAWSTCSKDSYSEADSKSPQPPEENGDYPDLLPDLCKEEQGELSRASSFLIDFLCSHLASHEWRAVARELGVSDVIIQSVEYDVYDNFREEMRFVFSFWVRSQKSQPHLQTCQSLERALAEIGRNDLMRELKSTDYAPDDTSL